MLKLYFITLKSNIKHYFNMNTINWATHQENRQFTIVNKAGDL